MATLVLLPLVAAVLIALAHHSGVLRAVFDKKRLKEQKVWIERICKDSAIAMPWRVVRSWLRSR